MWTEVHRTHTKRSHYSHVQSLCRVQSRQSLTTVRLEVDIVVRYQS